MLAVLVGLALSADDTVATFEKYSQYAWYGVIGVIVLTLICIALVLVCELFCPGNSWSVKAVEPGLDDSDNDETVESG